MFLTDDELTTIKNADHYYHYYLKLLREKEAEVLRYRSEVETRQATLTTAIAMVRVRLEALEREMGNNPMQPPQPQPSMLEGPRPIRLSDV